ncbi:MAG TPA: RNA polymerase sigma factor [Anaerolineales bacterium]|nr:RNA polymerase sigma factor [Anaerolineales bacterium]
MTVMDSQWLRQCREGDPLAIERLVHAHQADVYRLALSILDDPDEAEDAVQEVFVSALRSLDSFRGDSSLKTWLFSITINLCRSRYQRGQRRTRLRQILESLFRADQTGPESEAIRHEADSALWRAVRALDEKHRIPIILRYYHDLPAAEVAEMLGIPVGTVHSRLNHARERLRARLKEEER